MRIVVLALNAVFDTGLAAGLDAFRTAGELAGPHASFEVTLAGVRPEVRSAQGPGVPDVRIAEQIGYKDG